MSLPTFFGHLFSTGGPPPPGSAANPLPTPQVTAIPPPPTAPQIATAPQAPSAPQFSPGATPGARQRAAITGTSYLGAAATASQLAGGGQRGGKTLLG